MFTVMISHFTKVLKWPSSYAGIGLPVLSFSFGAALRAAPLFPRELRYQAGG